MNEQEKAQEQAALEFARALLHKSRLRRTTPNPRRSYATATV